MDDPGTFDGVLRVAEAAGFVDIAEEEINGAFDEVPEIILKVRHEEGIGNGKRHLDTVALGDFDGLEGGGFCIVRREQIALDVNIFRLGNFFLVDIALGEGRGDSEVGQHRAFGVIRDEDDAGAGLTGFGGRNGDVDSHVFHVFEEELTDLLVADLTGEGGAAAEVGDAHDRIGGAPAGAAADRAAVERFEDTLLRWFIDQRHDSLGELERFKDGVGDTGLNVDQGVADAVDVIGFARWLGISAVVSHDALVILVYRAFRWELNLRGAVRRGVGSPSPRGGVAGGAAPRPGQPSHFTGIGCAGGRLAGDYLRGLSSPRPRGCVLSVFFGASGRDLLAIALLLSAEGRGVARVDGD